MSARRLVIDCATPALSLALFDGADYVAGQHVALGRGHAEALLPAIAALPQGGRADIILVDTGPGSFTGVRVGLACALALAFGWRATVHGYGCLDLVGAMVRDKFAPRDEFPVVMIGGHGELFWSIQPPAPPAAPVAVRSTAITELAMMLDHAIFYGSGAQILVAARNGQGEAVPLLPDARCVDLLPEALRTAAPRPNYGRSADARPMADAAPA
jgi:tRNA threonylcarbamoyl adenosine modification protein YeaZ